MIPAELDGWMRPLEQFEAVRRGAVRLGDRLVDLSYANPYGGAQEAARLALRRALEQERLLDLQYTPFGGSTPARRAVADALRASHGAAFGFRDVVLTSGAMAALNIALRAACRLGDEVIIPIPCWLDYPAYVQAQGLLPVLVPLAVPDFELDTDAIAGSITPRTSAILVSQPANPTGRLYDRASLGRLAEAIRNRPFLDGRRITLIADETHRDFTEQDSFHSPMHEYTPSLVVYSFGKYHFLQGQRLGYVAVPPDHPDRELVAAELVRWTRALGLSTPTALMQRALPDLLVLRHSTAWLGELREHITERLLGAGYDVVRADATFFVYVRTPHGTDDLEFTRRLAASGLLVLPAPVFHHSGYFRLALTGSGDMIERAITILESAAT